MDYCNSFIIFILYFYFFKLSFKSKIFRKKEFEKYKLLKIV